MTPEQAAYARELADWAQPGSEGYDQGEWIYAWDRADEESPDDAVWFAPEAIPVAAMREGSCRTYACIAGRVVLDKAPASAVVVDGEALRLPDGEVVKISEFAQRELGLDASQAHSVFFANEGDAADRLRYFADHPDATVEEAMAATRNEED